MFFESYYGNVYNIDSTGAYTEASELTGEALVNHPIVHIYPMSDDQRPQYFNLFIEDDAT
jgi:hypothetical protein